MIDTPKRVVGLDKSNGKDKGALTEGYWLNGVFTITKVHLLTADGNICQHDFAATDDVLDYCIKCGETRRTLKSTIDIPRLEKEHQENLKNWDVRAEAKLLDELPNIKAAGE